MLEIVLFICGIALIIVLVWLLLPSTAYLTGLRWIRESGNQSDLAWLHYRSFKRLVTPQQIAMNAANTPDFTPEDLEQLNGLLSKLGQLPAEFIHPEIGEAEDPNLMDARNAQEVIPGRPLVLEVIRNGVIWNRTVLKRAEVVRCSPDFLMIERLLPDSSGEQGIAKVFADYLKENDLIFPGFRLEADVVRGFLHKKMIGEEAGSLFQALIRAHPENCFILESPTVGSYFNNDTMMPVGAEMPGQRSKVAEVRHCGLTRRNEPQWRIKALVKIQHESR